MIHSVTRELAATALAFVALLLACAWLYWPGLSGPFLFDDSPNLRNLQHIQGEWSWTSLGAYLAAFHGDPGRPLAALTFLLNDQSWPSDPWSFKYTNLLLHVFTGLMVFGLTRALVLAHHRHDASRRPKTQQMASTVALLASAAWLLHPVQVSAVFQVVQRMTILSALFVLAGLWAYVALLVRAHTWRGVFAALAVLAMATGLAFLCKENGALAPLYAWTLHATVLRRALDQHSVPARRLAVWSIRIAAILPFLVFLLRPDSWLDYSRRAYTLGERLLTQPRVLLDYLQSIALPRISGGGSLFHDDYVFSTSLVAPPSTLFALIVVTALLAAGFWLRRQRPWLALALLWFFAGHSIESTFVSLELYFEHRNYVPLLGPVAALAYLACTARARLRGIVLLAIVAWLALAAFVTHQHARVWGDEALLAEVWGAEHPDSSRATQLRAKVRFDRGNHDAARAIFEDAVRSGRGDENALLYLLYIDCQRGAPISADLLRDNERALRAQLPSIGALELLRALRETISDDTPCPGFAVEDWLRLSDAMLQNPRVIRQQDIFAERAQVRYLEGDFEGMVLEQQAAYAHDPTPAAANLVAIILATGGYYDEAIAWVQRGGALPMSPFKAWLTQRERTSVALLSAIQQSQQEAQQAKPTSEPQASPPSPNN